MTVSFANPTPATTPQTPAAPLEASTHNSTRLPHVVIIGGGFAGLSAARALSSSKVRITLLDRTNHHLFQPLLYQVATAVLNPADICVPIRWLLRDQANATVVIADVDSIDPASQLVSLNNGTESLAFDYLILAAGARHSYFGHPEWEAHAPGLKSIDDALEMRGRFLLSFEAAERDGTSGSDNNRLTFVIVGGGPTGVELAGMIPEVARHTLDGEFRRINPRQTRVLLLEGGPRILPALPEALSARAKRDLESLGVEVRTNCIVTSVDESGVIANGEHIAAHTVFWGAGNQASPLTQSLGAHGAQLDRAGRVVVNPDLSVSGFPKIYCAGDLAAAVAENGKPVPAVASSANQMGTTAGRNIARAVSGKTPEAFKFRNKGDLATIGRHRAVAVIGGLQLRGTFAWLTWLFVHILYLVGVRNRLSVLIQWGYQYFTFQRGVRLITASTVKPPSDLIRTPQSVTDSP